ncbi:N-acetylmuramoyl-L-alanine amidase [Georgenia sp. Z1344]|uniref:N-acetylmuramoyl-L-alanine amidase n=1 Tax=Georgenia sp. Z1344 TaxID=3416706 RepID=UPI003CED1B60
MSAPQRPVRILRRPRRAVLASALVTALSVPAILSPAVAEPDDSPTDAPTASTDPADPVAPAPQGADDSGADLMTDSPAPGSDPTPLQVLDLTDDAGEPTASGDAGAADPGRVSASALPGASAPNAIDAEVADAQESGDLTILTEEIDTEGFNLAGVTWAAGEMLPQDASIYVRTRAGGEWSSWADLEPESPGDDSLPGGTEPFLTTESDGVQVQVDPGSGELPADLRLTLVPTDVSGAVELAPDGPGTAAVTIDEQSVSGAPATAGSGGEVEGSGDAPALEGSPDAGSAPDAGSTPDAAPDAGSVDAQAQPDIIASRPNIISRWSWGANQDHFFWPPEYSELRAAVVHHTAGTNTYTYAEAPGVVRSIYYYHAQTRGWGDIGYNFLVDRWGRVYEGRYGSLWSPNEQMTIGAHAAPANQNTVGVSIMGDFTYGPAPQAAMNSVRDVIAWRFALADVDVDAPTGITSRGTSFAYAGQPLPAIMGHRDVAYQTRTICPGPYVAAALPGMMAEIRGMVGNEFYLSNTWTTTAEVEFEFGERGLEVLVGDWTGNGRDTVGVRHGNTIELTNGHDSVPDIVLNYGRPGDELLVGDWDRNGTDTLGVRRGNVLYLRNDMESGPAHVEFAYGRTDDELLVGDWTGNGRDTFAVRRGNRYFLTNGLAAGPASTVLDYGRAGDQVVVGDWDGNGTDTFTVRRGNRYFMRNDLRTGDAHREIGFGRADDRVIAGDWDRNGTDTLGVVR